MPELHVPHELLVLLFGREDDHVGVAVEACGVQKAFKMRSKDSGTSGKRRGFLVLTQRLSSRTQRAQQLFFRDEMILDSVIT